MAVCYDCTTTASEEVGAPGADRRTYIPGGDVAGGGVDLTGDPLEGDWCGKMMDWFGGEVAPQGGVVAWLALLIRTWHDMELKTL